MDSLRDGVTSASEIEALRRELAEKHRQQAATSDVLRIVSRSAADAAPVFEAILDACVRVFSPYGAALFLVEGDILKGVARFGFADGDWGTDATSLAGSSTGRASAERRPVHIVDLVEVAGLPEPKRAAVRGYCSLTTLNAPMISSERGVGSLVVARRPKLPFTRAEIASLGAFAARAVIVIEIRKFDNGAGVAQGARAKMSNPFFTTKPAGEGAGLGLSLTHDLVVKQRGGTIKVETMSGAFAKFIVTLSKGRATA